MNVLLTSVGRRCYLVAWFQQVLGGHGAVAVCDMSPTAPGLGVADIAAVVPAVHDPAYIDAVAQLCDEHSIDMVIPLHDLDIHYLTSGAVRLARVGARLVAPSPEVAWTCFDKLATAEFMASKGIPHPRTLATVDEALQQVEKGEMGLPVIVKPRWGSASLGVELVTDLDTLEPMYERVRGQHLDPALQRLHTDGRGEILVQEYLDGDEYHLDIVNDLDGRYAATLSKQKLAMRAGETDKAVSVNSPDLELLGSRVGNALGHVGNLDTDVIVVDGVPTVLEVNPRFGGGYPFSHIAGANVPGAILEWAKGRTPPADWLRLNPGVVAAKFDQLAIVSAQDGEGLSATATVPLPVEGPGASEVAGPS